MVVETRQRYVLVDPTTLPIVPEFEGAPRLEDLNEHFGIVSIKYHAKPSASKPADPAVIAEMAKECDYVIVGIGD